MVESNPVQPVRCRTCIGVSEPPRSWQQDETSAPGTSSAHCKDNNGACSICNAAHWRIAVGRVVLCRVADDETRPQTQLKSPASSQGCCLHTANHKNGRQSPHCSAKDERCLQTCADDKDALRPRELRKLLLRKIHANQRYACDVPNIVAQAVGNAGGVTSVDFVQPAVKHTGKVSVHICRLCVDTATYTTERAMEEPPRP